MASEAVQKEMHWAEVATAAEHGVYRVVRDHNLNDDASSESSEVISKDGDIELMRLGA